jgi:DNA-binding Lrp family transcriptional regulator
VREPYKAIAKELRVSEDEVLFRMQQLVAEGIIRDIGPVYDSKALGFASTLVALKVDEDEVNEAGAIINGYAGVSHSYEREGEYNIWFTLTAPSKEELASALDEILGLIKPQKALDIPVQRVLKLKTKFIASPTPP